MNTKNPYEYLKTPCLADVDPVEAQSTWCVTEERDEVVTIFSSLIPDGHWVYGFVVHWANGRTSIHQPSASLGLFKSQREAKLYAVGFMLLYADYFTEATKSCLRRAEASLIQAELF